MNSCGFLPNSRMCPTKGFAPGSTGGSLAFGVEELLSDMQFLVMGEKSGTGYAVIACNDIAKGLDILRNCPHYDGWLRDSIMLGLLWG